MWAALGGVGVILAGIMTVGAILEDDSDASTADAVAAANAEQSPQPAQELQAEPSSSADAMICDTTGLFSDPCKFGQTAICSRRARSGELQLEITVGAPVELELSEFAIIPFDLPRNPVSVYFSITVKNTSPESATPSMILTQATNAEQGTHGGIWNVSDGDVDSFAVSRGVGMPVGESLSVKGGWNMARLEGVEYSLSINGLAGYTIKFTR
ncbi:hypothetical protein GS495_16070 [Rhodococcus hoagii]|nr:hypothetical protein [Prescottella equi]